MPGIPSPLNIFHLSPLSGPPWPVILIYLIVSMVLVVFSVLILACISEAFEPGSTLLSNGNNEQYHDDNNNKPKNK